MSITPMMQQYLDTKVKCQDCILFFRIGDFYEMFFDDAKIASKELELVLTGKDCGLTERAPMCGIPFHAASSYISRLINRGYKVAICEQTEDPSKAVGLVKRDIIKIITPGTYTDPSYIEDRKNNFLMCLYAAEDNIGCGMAFADISTGEFYATSTDFSISKVFDEISKFNPSEIIIETGIDNKIVNNIKNKFQVSLTFKEKNIFTDNALLTVQKQFKDINVSDIDSCVLYASTGLLNYIDETQKMTLSNIGSLSIYNISNFLSIDSSSRRNLELTQTLISKSKKGSLLYVMDKTSTAMGGRLIRKWIEEPLTNVESIVKRLDAVEEFYNNQNLNENIVEILNEIYDIERISGRVSSKSINAREMLSLKNSIKILPMIKKLLKESKSECLKQIQNELDTLDDIYDIIDNSIAENPPISVKEGDIIKDGFDSEIDELRKARLHGKEWLLKIESDEKEKTGIKTLKIGHNDTFGYYIDVTKANIALVPKDRYIRKQTLVNSERYITVELKDVEEKIGGASEKLKNREYELFCNVRDKIESQILRLKKSSEFVAYLDCLSSFAVLARENNYVRPLINTDGKIEIKEGRHPSIEKLIPYGTFIANDALLDNNENQLLLITGPNMAGKSTYMRQVALIVIMAQMGSFVPAKSANISVCDKIFTRIGASDDLSQGKSTFMVEMSEVSNILKNATPKSLVLLDEVGRGTSTFDGLSIAWAVIEYICKTSSMRCKTLFATHYHELIELEGKIKGIKNYSIKVKKDHDDIVFLRKIIRGGADESYGIEVAKLAGLPAKVVTRAREILDGLEKSKNPVKKTEQTKAVKKKETKQLDFTDLAKENIIREISSIDVLNMTPIESMDRLNEIVKKAKALDI